MGAAFGVFLAANISTTATFSFGIVLAASSVLALVIYERGRGTGAADRCHLRDRDRNDLGSTQPTRGLNTVRGRST